MEQNRTKTATTNSTGLQSLSTGIIILQAFAKREDAIGVSQLAREIGMPKAKVHRYLITLRDIGYLEQDPTTDQYRAGWGLYLLAHDVQHHFSLVRRARPFMQDVSNQVNMTVVLSTFSSGEFIVLDFVAPPSPLEMGLRAGSHFPLNAGAQGKIGLAFGSDTQRESFFAKPLPQVVKETPIDVDKLRAEIEVIRRRHWAVAPSQLFEGINALAVPVFGPEGNLACALAIVGLNSTLKSEPDAETISVLQKSSLKLSQILGFSPPKS